MNAETLRKAATILRERAEAVQSHSSIPSADIWFEADVDLRNAITGTFKGNVKSARDDAHWIALMTPGVGLALADWLDAETEHVASHLCEAHCEYPDGSARCRAAVTLARLIVGEQS